jgi:sarcosine oxidase subunit beta
VMACTVAMKAAGVDLRERTPVTGLRIEGGRVRGVLTEHGTIATERVILAGGVGQGDLTALTGGPAVPVGGARHQIAVTSPHPALAQGPLPMAFELASGLYWRQEEGGILFGMSNPQEQPGEAREIDWDFLRTIRERLAQLLPPTRELGLRRVWTATIDYTPDHLPILGPALDAARDPVAGITVASPGGHGMMWGPAVARVAADLALHGSSDVTDASFLGPDRFDEHGVSRLETDPIALPFPETVG